MGAITPTEVSFGDMPMTNAQGASTRLVIAHLRAPATTSAGSTLNFATYIPGVIDIVGIIGETDAGVAEGTASTWSTSTLTVSSGAAGAYEGTFLVRTTV